MKKVLLFVFVSLFILVSADAQPPQLDNTFLPQMGKFFSGRSFYRTQSWSVVSGPNVTWDFTPLEANYITNYSFAFRNKPTTGTQGLPLFPGAAMTQMAYFGEDSIENFIRVDNGQLMQMGYKYKGWDGNEVYNPNRIDFKTGLAFQDDISISTSSSVLNIQGAPPQYFKQYDTLAYGGYGTMITTFGTYQNVPMIKRNFSTWFSATETGNYSMHLLGKHWYWYLPGFGAPYIRYTEEVFLLTPDQPMFEGYIGFIAPVVGNQTSQNRSSIQVFPTRLEGNSMIYFSGINPAENTEYVVSDALGRVSLSGKLNGNSLRVSEIPSGIYQISLRQSGQTNTTRFVKE